MPTMNLYEVGKLQILYNLASFFHADRYFLRMFSSISSLEALPPLVRSVSLHEVLISDFRIAIGVSLASLIFPTVHLNLKFDNDPNKYQESLKIMAPIKNEIQGCSSMAVSEQIPAIASPTHL